MWQPDAKTYEYYESRGVSSSGDAQGIPRELMNRMLLAIGEEVLRNGEGTSRAELEKMVDEIMAKEMAKMSSAKGADGKGWDDIKSINSRSILAYLEEEGYINRGKKRMLTGKGFMSIGMLMLKDMLKAFKDSELGTHETSKSGHGTITLESSRRYEYGDDLKELNVPKSMLNAVERIMKEKGRVDLPIEFKVEDLEQYEMLNEVKMAVVYCIDLSSTMRYSSLNDDVSRIEAAKKALWCLYILNRKLFPSDAIHLLGFGALAMRIMPKDIPYLKTFEPGHDFLHYTNYQAAFRLAVKILNREDATNKRVVMITDGQPSACFVDSEAEKERILNARPYSHFYRPDRVTLDALRDEQGIDVDTGSGSLVYLCYRYRQVDPYIATKTILEAKRCKRLGIDVDTLMVSEEDVLLKFINDMERHVKGRSYYINPSNLGKVLITDYILNKRQLIKA
ncbi:MAG: VWA domain-containing protein [Candidatus Nitrosocaldus sp.]|nr:VWA domain-containing protein [Candidatus Nitrosocaldus sp.]MDW8000000.1 VWA domain-containing protein [Candidatus Nitrosocaldus sp.]